MANAKRLRSLECSMELDDFSDLQEDTDADDDDDDDNYCCSDKCLSAFDDEFKSRLKSELSQLSSSEKHIYLFAMISINKEAKSRTKPSKSYFQFHYTVKEYGITRYVCKSAFMTLHETTHAHVRTLCKKMSENNLIPKDKRGRHEKQPTISENMKQQVKVHFYQTMESSNVSELLILSTIPMIYLKCYFACVSQIFQCAKTHCGEPNISKLWLDFKKHNG